jgi:deoxyribose-phosphate aldolase
MDIEKLIREVSEEVSMCGTLRHSAPEVSAFEVPSKLEHSMLVPDLSEKALLEACAQARRYHIAAVCIPPYYVAPAKRVLKNSGVAVCVAIGVPNALFSAEARMADVKCSLMAGADELDVSINTMAIKSGNVDDARRDLNEVVRASADKARVKVAVELSLFTEEEKVAVLRMIKESGAAYIKIQNVLSGKKAEVEDIKYVRGITGNNAKIKIDGGVKTLDAALSLIAGGADRIGLTATFMVAAEARK